MILQAVSIKITMLTIRWVPGSLYVKSYTSSYCPNVKWREKLKSGLSVALI
jgi:hypothetical protein